MKDVKIRKHGGRAVPRGWLGRPSSGATARGRKVLGLTSLVCRIKLAVEVNFKQEPNSFIHNLHEMKCVQLFFYAETLYLLI